MYFKKHKTCYINQRIWKMSKNFNIQDHEILAHEVQK